MNEGMLLNCHLSASSTNVNLIHICVFYLFIYVLNKFKYNILLKNNYSSIYNKPWIQLNKIIIIILII